MKIHITTTDKNGKKLNKSVFMYYVVSPLGVEAFEEISDAVDCKHERQKKFPTSKVSFVDLQIANVISSYLEEK